MGWSKFLPDILCINNYFIDKSLIPVIVWFVLLKGITGSIKHTLVVPVNHLYGMYMIWFCAFHCVSIRVISWYYLSLLYVFLLIPPQLAYDLIIVEVLTNMSFLGCYVSFLGYIGVLPNKIGLGGLEGHIIPPPPLYITVVIWTAGLSVFFLVLVLQF